MSLAIAHFALGAGVTALILGFFAPQIKYQRTLTIVGGMWALVPDLHYVSPIYADVLVGIKASFIGNLFWFHRLLDELSQGRGTRGEAFLMVIFLLLATLLTEYIELEIRDDR